MTVLVLLAIVSAVLIVLGRVNGRTSWGNWVAVVGFAVLAVALLLQVLTRP